jgi:2-polyprenyl-3-methyl-5-hydroxy-6-metoxy-1,4-benzoquinol methylase
MSFSSLERIYPDDENQQIGGGDTIALHIERYSFASQHLSPGHIADIACGSGYGSFFLAIHNSEEVKKITAIDNNAPAISYAKSHYPHAKISFINVNAFEFKPDTLFNTVISLETIEHLEDPVKFVNHISSLLEKGGRIIASAPTVLTTDVNPYHLNDFTKKSFRKLFTDSGLKEINHLIQVQPYKPFQLMKKKKSDRSKELRRDLLKYYFTHPLKLIKRMKSILSDGFRIKYLVVVFEKI